VAQLRGWIGSVGPDTGEQIPFLGVHRGGATPHVWREALVHQVNGSIN
jgi:hypothetical protein